MPPFPPLIVPPAELMSDLIVAPAAFETPAPPAARPAARAAADQSLVDQSGDRLEVRYAQAARRAHGACGAIDRSAVRQFRDRVGDGVDAVGIARDASRFRDRDRPAVAEDRADDRPSDDLVCSTELNLRRARRSERNRRAPV
jgi:hypothetical protein